MKRLSKYISISLVVLFAGCDKDSPKLFNDATLSAESTTSGAVEGDYIYVNLALSKPLSKDLSLRAEFDTNDILAYTNGDEDYTPRAEYSTNQGITWQSEDNNQVKFGKGQTIMKIRIQTKADDKNEITEHFNLRLAPLTTQDLDITNNIRPVTCSIEDNNNTLYHPYSPQSPLMQFRLDLEAASGAPAYTLVSVLNTLVEEGQKRIIDGKYTEVMDNIVPLLKLTVGATKLTSFELLYRNSGLGGYVFPTSEESDEWAMGLNTLFAYKDINAASGTSSPTSPPDQEYNANGTFANILVHEMGHLFTLNRTRQVDLFDDRGEAGCTTFSIQEGCSKPESYINKFYQRFYVGMPALNEPAYVSDYASTNETEDIAETFAHYMTQPDIPAADTASSGALQKLNFIQMEAADVARLKSTINSLAKLNLLLPNTILSEFNTRRIDGKKISCLNHSEFYKE